MENFEPGDIVVFKESEHQIGLYDLSFLTAEQAEKVKARYREFRAEVVRIFEDRFDKDGLPCFRIRRLDTKGHGLETWTQQVFVKES